MLWVLLVALCLIAVGFVAWPMVVKQNRDIDTELSRSSANTDLYKSHIAELDASYHRGDIDDDVYNQLQSELGRSLLEDNQAQDSIPSSVGGAKPVLAVLLVVVPLVSMAFYYLRAPHTELALRDTIIEQNRLASLNPQGITSEEINVTEQIVVQLERLLKEDPENLSNRYMLARNLVTLKDFSGAIEAYQEILSRDPKQPQVLAEFGQTIFMASGTQMLPQVKTLADSALALDPNNTLALSLAGITTYEQQEYQQALTYWQKAVALLGQDNPEAEPLIAGIANIQNLLAHSGGDVEPTGTDSAAKNDSSSDQISVSVNVRLADSVSFTPDQTVFVYARAWQGPKMPLAIKRISASELPITVTLTESMSMMEGMTIATVDAIELVARLSTDGSPTTKPGDWQASIGPVQQSAFDQSYQLQIATKIE